MNAPLVTPLSPGERDVLLHTAMGLYVREIALLRGTSPNVVQNQRGHAFIKLGAYSSTEAVALLLVTDQDFYNDVRQAVFEGKLKPDYGKGSRP